MARAAVPEPHVFRAEAQFQLGFDFGASPRAATAPEATVREATAPATPTPAAGTPAVGTPATSAPLATTQSHPAQSHPAQSHPAQSAQALAHAEFAFGSGIGYESAPDASASPPNNALRGGTDAPRSRGRAAVRARTAVLFSRLQDLGLRGIESLVLMRTRTVMVSLIGQTLRVHEGYADAPELVLRAIVTFATARNRAVRSSARDVILAHDVERAPAARRHEPARPGDLALISSLVIAHRELNAKWFAGTLNEIPIRLSGRMATRLGHFDPGSRLTPPEIVMSRRHVVRHGWKEAMHTLLHEMVHQWQHETGQPVDHLGGFRKKCREVGIAPSARRDVVPLKPRRQRGVA